MGDPFLIHYYCCEYSIVLSFDTIMIMMAKPSFLVKKDLKGSKNGIGAYIRCQ